MKRGKPEKYIVLAETIRQYIKDSAMKKGEQLTPERRLAEIFAVNHLTLRKSLRLLEQEKLIYKEPSRGNFIGSRPLAAKKNGLVGFIFPDDEIFYYRIFAELEKFFSDFGLHPLVHITRNIKENEDKILDCLESSGVEALIAAPNQLCIERYRTLKIPVIFFDLFIPGLPLPHIVSDDYAGAQKIITYLLNLGHSRIACINGTYEHTSTMRLQGYLDVMKTHNINIPEQYIKCRELSREWGYYAAKELFALTHPPTAIFCGNDTVAAGVFKYLNAHNIKTPEACSLCGFGNTEVAEDLDLTSVSQHTVKIAAAIRGCLQIMMRGNIPPVETVINTTLVVRGSCSVPAITS